MLPPARFAKALAAAARRRACRDQDSPAPSDDPRDGAHARHRTRRTPPRRARCWADCARGWTTSRSWSCRRSRTSSTPSASWPSAAPCSARACSASTGSSGRSAAARGYSDRVASEVQRELLLEEAVERAGSSVLAGVGRPAGLRARGRPLRGRARRLDAGGARRASPRRCGPGRGTDRGAATRTRSPRSTAATATALEAAGLVDASCSPGARSTRCGATGALGRHAGVRLRLRRLHPLELDALETLAIRCGADVVVSLPFEPRQEPRSRPRPPRAGAAGARGASERSLAAAGRPLRARPRAPRSTTSSAGCSKTAPGQADAGAAIAFHSAGGERAEVELAGARVLELLRDGIAPGDVAVVFREPARLLVAGRAGVRRLRHPVLARASRAVRPHRPRPRAAGADPLRAPGGSADDLLAYLRTPRPPATCRRWRTGSRRRCARRARTARSRRALDLGARALASSTTLEAWRTRRGRPAAYVAELERGAARACSRAAGRSAAILRGPVLAGPDWTSRARAALGDTGRAAGAAQRAVRDGRGGRSVRRRHPSRGGGAARPGTGPARARGSSRSWARTRSRTGCRWPAPRRSARAASRPSSSAGSRRASSRAAPARAVPPGRRPPRDGRGERPGAPAARGPARPRALPLLRLRLARRAAAGAQLALERRGGQPEARRSSSTTCATCSAPGSPSRGALARGGHLDARGGAHRGRVGSRAGGARPEARPRPARTARRRAAAGRARRARGRLGQLARALRRLPRQVARGERTAARGARARPEQMVRGHYAHAVLEHTFRRAARGDRRAPRDAREPRPGRAHPARGAARAAARSSALAASQTRVRAAARRLEFDLRPPPAPRGRARRQLRARAASSCASATGRASSPVASDRRRPAGARDASTGWTRTTAWRS